VFGGWRTAPGLGRPAAAAEIAQPADLPKLTEAMLRRGFTEPDIRHVLGDNVLRVLRSVMGLPTVR
jgi:membrane dipeptidase